MTIHINEAMKSFIHPLIYIAETRGLKSKGFQTPSTRFANEMRQAVYFSRMLQSLAPKLHFHLNFFIRQVAAVASLKQFAKRVFRSRYQLPIGFGRKDLCIKHGAAASPSPARRRRDDTSPPILMGRLDGTGENASR